MRAVFEHLFTDIAHEDTEIKDNKRQKIEADKDV